MATLLEQPVHSVPRPGLGRTNGAAMAAFLAAGIGAFAMGFIVLLNEAGIFSVPAVYEPAGGLSGRSTLAVVIWLAVWAVLHRRWRSDEVPAGKVFFATLVLILLGLLATFPPLWGLL